MPFGVKPVCVSCNISSSPIWRKGPQGEVLCNSCGIKQANGSSLYGVNIKENGVVNGGKKTDAQSSGNGGPVLRKSARLKPAKKGPQPAKSTSTKGKGRRIIFKQKVSSCVFT